ncbi:hypothetical protein BCR39DRAFT_465372 [Naematelia encephala]|uniref:Uncharacterized protein n=1 Tax=Naematelia encephala TaxID=71784 RepID=A0A1Y2BAE6_9TREE|nr:hypothetical protein BCR39DRAFT_465372 [Naematelia encephala]
MPPGVSSSESARLRARAEEEARARHKHKEDPQKEYAKRVNPRTEEEMIEGEELVKEYFEDDADKWVPSWANVEFDDDACLKNITKAGKTADGYFAPAGTQSRILPLGASFQPMTVLKYGGYFPPGTSFPGGILTPIHARMVNILPQETDEHHSGNEESMCVVQ